MELCSKYDLLLNRKSIFRNGFLKYGWVGGGSRISTFLKIFYQNTKIIKFSKSIFRHSLLKYGGWVGPSKISTFFKRFYQNLNDMKFFKICYHTLKGIGPYGPTLCAREAYKYNST